MFLLKYNFPTKKMKGKIIIFNKIGTKLDQTKFRWVRKLKIYQIGQIESGLD